MEEHSRYSDTKTPMRFALVIEAFFVAISIGSMIGIFYIDTLVDSENGDLGLFIILLVGLSVIGLLYIPGFIVNVILYRRIHQKNIPPKKASRVFTWHLIYGIINLLIANALLGAIYLITYSKGRKAVEKAERNDAFYR
ncbi:MAG: hypothetical protein ACQEQA_05770 [Bacillota bacterium]